MDLELQIRALFYSLHSGIIAGLQARVQLYLGRTGYLPFSCGQKVNMSMLFDTVNPDVLPSPQEWTDLKVWSLAREMQRPTKGSCLESVHECCIIFQDILHRCRCFRGKAFWCSTHMVTLPYISSSAASCSSRMDVAQLPGRYCLQTWRAKGRIMWMAQLQLVTHATASSVRVVSWLFWTLSLRLQM